MAPVPRFARLAPTAAECTPSLRILNSVQMQATTDRTVMVVPVKIDNADKKLLLDTGGLVSQISRATAAALDLPERYREQRLFDLAGNSLQRRGHRAQADPGQPEPKRSAAGGRAQSRSRHSLPYDGLLATDFFPATISTWISAPAA